MSATHPAGEFVSPSGRHTDSRCPADIHERGFRESSLDLSKGSDVVEADPNTLPSELVDACHFRGLLPIVSDIHPKDDFEKAPISELNATSFNREADDVGRDAQATAVLQADLMDHLDAMVSYWDGERRCRLANRAHMDWFGRTRHEMAGISLQELLGPLYGANLPHIEAAYRGERQVFERPIPWPDGRGVRNSLATYLPRIVAGEVLGVFVHVVDVEPLKRLESALMAARDAAESLALHDPLTGLPNRRLLEDRLAEVMRRSRRTAERVYVLSVDVDHFKSINDGYGHAAGDALLIELAARIKSCLREYDTVARMGGDEFVVLAAGISSGETIEVLVERILVSARKPIAFGGAWVTPTLSVGVAAFPLHGPSSHELLHASDRALYAAKRAGRDCFRVAW